MLEVVRVLFVFDSPTPSLKDLSAFKFGRGLKRTEQVPFLSHRYCYFSKNLSKFVKLIKGFLEKNRSEIRGRQFLFCSSGISSIPARSFVFTNQEMEIV